MISRIIIFNIIITLFFSVLFANENELDKIVRNFDQLYRSNTSYAQIVMLIKNPNFERELKMKVWTKGLNETFIRILSPKKDAGIQTLRKGDEMWNYFPKIDKVLKVPPSMRMGSWMGSDFTNDDLVKETTLLDDYNYRFASETKYKKDLDHYYIELLPKENTISVWGKILLKLRKSDLIPIFEEFFDESGDLTRVIYFEQVKVFNKRKIPSMIRLVPLKKKEHQTIIRYESILFDLNIESKIFSLRNLRKKRVL